MTARCQQGRFRLATVTQARGDLAGVARLATRPGVAGERAQKRIPAARAELDRQRAALDVHDAECATCAAVFA